VLFQIKQLLSEEALAAVDRILAATAFASKPAETAIFGAPKPVVTLDLAAAPETKELDSIIVKAISGHALFRAAVLPKMVLTPLYCRHEPGTDSALQQSPALVGDPGQIRSDVQVSVFLSAPESYEGGELVLQTSGEEARVKLPRGTAVVHDASFFHRVLPIQRGARLTAVTWAQSLIRDSSQREMLFELDRVARKLKSSAPDSDAAKLTAKSYGNLFRMWAEV
jgi:PKHD-type hydroxylase